MFCNFRVFFWIQEEELEDKTNKKEQEDEEDK